MGVKIIIDLVMMMNKGLEVIEVYWFFDFFYEKIDVLLYKESIIYFMVEYLDISVIV